MNQTIFAQGMIVKPRHERAPEWVVANYSFKVDEFIKTLTENDNNGWVNVQVCVGTNGKPYAKVDTWKPETQSGNANAQIGNTAPQRPMTSEPPPFDDEPMNDIPF